MSFLPSRGLLGEPDSLREWKTQPQTYPSLLRSDMVWSRLYGILQLNNISIYRRRFDFLGDVIGSGEFFEVCRYKIPLSEMPTFRTIHSREGLIRGTVVAIKRIRPQDQPSFGENALKALTAEVSVLSKRRIHDHENIVTMHNLIWEDRGSDQAMWPSLVLEYCPITLAELQAASPRKLDNMTKVQLVQQIGMGLDVIHEESFVHGDLKSENILVQISNDGVIIPKVADFSSSLLIWESEELVQLGGTPPWRAPELELNDGFVPLKYAFETDDYSFALLASRLLLDGVSPFRHVYDLDTVNNKNDANAVIQELKMSNAVGDMIACDFESTFGKPFVTMIRANLDPDPRKRGLAEDHPVNSLELDLPPGNSEDASRNEVAPEQHPHSLIPLRDSLDIGLFPNTIFNLYEIIRLEKIDSFPRPSRATCHKIVQEMLGFLGKWIADQPDDCKLCSEISPFDKPVDPLYDKRPSLNDFLNILRRVNRHTCEENVNIKGFYALATSSISGNDMGRCIMNLSACYLDGYGISPDITEALRWLVFGGRRGLFARGELLSIYTNLGLSIPSNVPLITWAMWDVVVRGSPTSAETLRRLFPEYLAISEEARSLLFDGMELNLENIDETRHLKDLRDEDIETVFSSFANDLRDYVTSKALEDVESWDKSPLHDLAACWPEPIKLFPLVVERYPHLLESRTIGGETPLLLACRAGRLRSAAALLELGANPNTTAGVGGETPLHWLAMRSDAAALIDVLLASGADVNAVVTSVRIYPWMMGRVAFVDQSGLQYTGTPLHWAVVHGNESTVRLLLSRGARADLTSSRNATPCHIAATMRHPRLLEVLLDSVGFIQGDLATGLLRELWLDLTEYQKVLLGYTPQDEIDTFNVIISHIPAGHTVEDTEKTFRHIIQKGLRAASLSFLTHIIEGLDFCLQVCSDSDAAIPGSPLARPVWNNDFFPFLHDAVQRDDPEVLELVLKKGLDINQRDVLEYSCLHVLARNNGSTATLDILLRHGASFEWRNNGGYCPIQTAVFSGHTGLAETMRQLLSSEQCDRMLGKNSWMPRTDSRHPDNNFTFLGHLIFFRGIHGMNIEGVAWLLDLLGRENSLVVSSKTNDTVLHLAVDYFDDTTGIWKDYWSLPILKLLLSRFTSPTELDFANSEGTTALHMAVWLGKAEAVRLLIAAGANVDVVSPLYGTALDTAFSGPPNYFTARQQNGTLTRSQVEGFVQGRNDAARYLRRAGAKALEEIQSNVRLGDWIPFPYGIRGGSTTHRRFCRAPLLKRYGNAVFMPIWGVPSFVHRELRAKGLVGFKNSPDAVLRAFTA